MIKKCYYCRTVVALKPWKVNPDETKTSWACSDCWNKYLSGGYGPWSQAANYLKNQVNCSSKLAFFKKKTMPKIEKVKKKTSLPVVKTTKKSRPKKITKDPVSYYSCLLTKAQRGWFDPTIGRKKKITACCKDCKLNAPTLNEQRSQELKKLITSYQQVGESLKRLLKPI